MTAATRSRFTEDERRRAVEQARDLITEQGYTQNQACKAVAEEVGVSPRSVGMWAVDLGEPLPFSARAKAKTAAASAAVVDYSQERRRELSDVLFTKVRELADATRDPSELKDLATTYGILVDKRRLEEGKATERTETVDQRAALDRARQNLRSIAGGKAV